MDPRYVDLALYFLDELVNFDDAVAVVKAVSLHSVRLTSEAYATDTNMPPEIRRMAGTYPSTPFIVINNKEMEMWVHIGAVESVCELLNIKAKNYDTSDIKLKDCTLSSLKADEIQRIHKVTADLGRVIPGVSFMAHEGDSRTAKKYLDALNLLYGVCSLDFSILQQAK